MYIIILLYLDLENVEICTYEAPVTSGIQQDINADFMISYSWVLMLICPVDRFLTHFVGDFRESLRVVKARRLPLGSPSTVVSHRSTVPEPSPVANACRPTNGLSAGQKVARQNVARILGHSPIAALSRSIIVAADNMPNRCSPESLPLIPLGRHGTCRAGIHFPLPHSKESCGFTTPLDSKLTQLYGCIHVTIYISSHPKDSKDFLLRLLEPIKAQKIRELASLGLIVYPWVTAHWSLTL